MCSNSTGEKVKFAYCSDLHLEFWPNKKGFPKYPELKNTENAKVLILAGDITQFNLFLDSDRFDGFFQHVNDEFPLVVWVPGNHEWYGSLLNNKSLELVSEKLRQFPRVHLLEKDFRYLGRTHFLIAATLWTDLNKNCPITAHEIMWGMADYQHIKTDAFGGVSSIIPEDTYNKHVEHIQFIDDMLSDTLTVSPDRKIVLVTHHAPSEKSVHSRFKRYTNMNHAFYTDLEYVPAINPNLKYWVHGHTHDHFYYDMLGCRVVCNPHGYINHEEIAKTFQLKYFEV